MIESNGRRQKSKQYKIEPGQGTKNMSRFLQMNIQARPAIARRLSNCYSSTVILVEAWSFYIPLTNTKVNIEVL